MFSIAAPPEFGVRWIGCLMGERGGVVVRRMRIGRSAQRDGRVRRGRCKSVGSVGLLAGCVGGGMVDGVSRLRALCYVVLPNTKLDGSIPPSMTRVCQRCNVPMERGFTTAHGLIGGDRAPEHRAQLLFVVPGTPTSSNPLKAFAQGRSDGPSDRRYGIAGWRCTGCGLLEFCSDGDPVA